MKRQLLFLLILFWYGITTAQSGILQGVIEEDNGPLPGASLLIKGTTTGTQTDFDGKYTIACEVGDVIIVSYVGYASWEFEVTSDMLGQSSETPKVKKEAVAIISNDAFSMAIPKQNDSLFSSPELKNSVYGYTAKYPHRITNIKDITLQNKVFHIATYDPRTAFEINLTSFTGIENVSLSNIYAPSTFENPIISTHSLAAGIYNNSNSSIEINGSYTSYNDFYGLTNNNKSRLNTNYETLIGDWKFAAYAGGNWSHKNFANLNGFQNKILQLTATNVNLDLNQLFTSLESYQTTSQYSAKGKVSKHLTDWLDLSSSINAIFSNRQEKSNQTSITPDAPINLFKKWKNFSIQSHTNLKSDFDLSEDISISTSTQFKTQHYALDFIGVDRITTDSFQNLGISKFTTEINNNISADFQNVAFLSLSNNSFSSSLQNDEWFIPSATLTFIPTAAIRGLKGEFINYISFTGRYVNSIKDAPLWYSNYSHNTLQIDENELLNFSNNIELFADSSLELERSNGFEITSTLRLAGNDISVDFSYNQYNHENVVFPILESGVFRLNNAANTRTTGFDSDISARLLHGYDKDLDWKVGVTLSRKRTITTQLKNDQTIVPISGFNTVNGNLIKGEVAGIITDRDGIIIGDPTPDYNLTHYHEFRTGRLKWQFYIDYQQGGEIWNARAKTIANNVQADREFIESRSFLSLSNLQVSYDFINKSQEDTSFFRNLTASASLNNLLLWTAFDEASPYNTLLDNSLGNSFQLYNTPNISSIGFKITAKI